MPDVFDTLTESSTGQDIFDLVGNDSPTPETDKALADQGGILSRLKRLAKTPSPQFLQPFEQRAKAFAQGAGVPGSLEEVKQFVTRNPIQDIKDIYTDVSKIPERVRNIGQTLQTSPAATVARAPLSPEAFQVYGTTAAMLAPAVIKARETPVARPEGEAAPTTPRGVEPATEATTEARGAVPEQPLTQGGEVTDAQQRSNAQVQGGDATLGVEARPEGEVSSASSGDNVVGETSGEKPVVEGAPPQEDVAVTPPPLNKENLYYEKNLQARAYKLAQGFVWDGEKWIHPDYPNATPFSEDVPPPKQADVLREITKLRNQPNEIPESVRTEPGLSQSAVPVENREQFPEGRAGKMVGIGEYATFTEPVVQYRNGQPFAATKTIRGKVTAIRPNGDIELKGQEGGYYVKKPSELTQPGGGDEPATAAVSGAETPPAAETPPLPKNKQVTLKAKTIEGEDLEIKMDAQKAERMITRRRNNLQALLDCLGT